MKNKDIMTTITGCLMAFADSVPGVSGGTIAYITGKYDELINSVKVLTSKSERAQKKQALQFIVKLALGWVVGFIIAILFITSIIESHIYQLSSLFMGFVLASLPLIIRQEKQVLAKHYLDALLIIVGTVIVVSISYFSSSSLNILGDDISLLSYIYIFVAGVIAISAMLLPGISGSTLLIIFGLYIPIITAVKNVIKFDFSGLAICIVFGLGILFGMKFTTTLISNALKHHRSKIVYLIIGFMIGSLYAIAVGPQTLVDEVTKESLNLQALSLDTFNVVYFVFGALTIFGLDYVGRNTKR